ncbi:MAG: hypothetical protein COV26_02055 [Candidatus Nealsonbacteria bacterium CG10_big_fil_rev_8_21_14_0_10_36_23]|uniref:Uncharacterized protein n=1 Tax=Candidatus Nealsonbacteria bacterium CG10_big_fil_rev_8_21_14_0_10_36_23 TaxID=1974709 RepID=A0A2H0TKV8_9BACT|nr:MAG: hypothetical protein COV26_02055 [Candidatus Nealsonbacteria bacterium CG10_big_fil_rev_8_21_14_0_10_36_23]
MERVRDLLKDVRSGRKIMRKVRDLHEGAHNLVVVCPKNEYIVKLENAVVTKKKQQKYLVSNLCSFGEGTNIGI